MNELLRVLAEKLKGAQLGSKAIALLTGVALVALLGFTVVFSGKKHLELAFSGLSDHEVAEVNKALADAGIVFEVSQPPGPFSVWVERSERSAAYRAAYGAGALDKPLEGILADSGVSSVFQGSEERLQSVRKREWQEMEGMLEVLDFVVSARVRTSPGSVSPVTGKPAAPLGASVTLRLAGGELSASQAQTVAQLVSRGLGIEANRIVISDQSGNQLFDGNVEDADERKVSDLLAQRERYDRQATEAANAVLAQTLGPDKARITVRSEWDYDQSTVRIESPSGKATLVSEHRNTTETPMERVNAATGAAGIDANVATEQESPPAEPPAPLEPLVSKTSEEDKEYQTTLKTEERVRFVPTLERLSVAVFLDESLDQALVTQLEGAIKAAVGFVEERDEFHSVRLPFVAEEPAPEGEAAATTTPEEPNRMLEVLLERGVEIVVSLVFVVLLLKSLKGSRSKSVAPQAAAGSREPDVDPELLARARIEELLASDPEKVGSILSSWAKGEPIAGARP